MPDPLIKTLTVNAPPARAFEIFTVGIADWWPGQSHSVSAADNALPQAITIEPHTGGAIYEITNDGQRANWGKITHWDPARSFAMTWHPGASPDQATLVRVDFEPVETGTRVTLTHTGWEALGTQAANRRASYDPGWNHVLMTCYAGAMP